MKAQLVYENLDFERGRDPKKTIKDWNRQNLIDKIESLWDWSRENDPYYISMNGVSQIEEMIYNALNDEGIGYWKDLSTKILEEFISYLEENKRHVELNENIDFERGQDPKSAMDIGSIRSIDATIERFMAMEHNSYNATGSINVYMPGGSYGNLKMIEMPYSELFHEYKSRYIRNILLKSGLAEFLEPGVDAQDGGPNKMMLYWEIKPQYWDAFKKGKYELYALHTAKGYRIEFTLGCKHNLYMRTSTLKEDRILKELWG